MSKPSATKMTPEALYEEKDRDVLASLDEMLKGDQSIEVLGNVAMYAIKRIEFLLGSALNKPDDDRQKNIVNLSKCLENANQVVKPLQAAMDNVDGILRKVSDTRTAEIKKIQEFLAACGVRGSAEEKTQQATKLANPTKLAKAAPQDQPKSYAAAMGTSQVEQPNEFVVEKPPVKVINRVNQRTDVINTGVVSICVPFVERTKECANYTLTYSDDKGVFVIKMGNSIFTAGPGNFIDNASAKVAARRAKRCSNPKPCSYRNCRFYHDPCDGHLTHHYSRNFTLSYAKKMLAHVKDADDLCENDTVRDPCFLRDLVQLGGIILLKAAQIKSLHFPNQGV